jgi:NAD(P)-dependent dehydrogenase (short-subunit alcohol dehydrogenase family)
MSNIKKNQEIGDDKQKVAIVTGSSSGIGYATALRLARNGYLTFATMRNPAKGTGLIKIAEHESLPVQVERMDVTDIESIKEFMERMRQSTGRVDVLVNNAGYVLAGALEDVSAEEIRKQFDTNLLGAIQVTQQVLPVMRAQRSGVIVNMGSLMGRLGLPGASAYVATKFAMEGICESLAYEVAPFGISVVLVEPGPVKTRANDNTIVGRGALRQDSPYLSMLGNVNAALSAWYETGISADQVAETVVQAVSSPQPKLRYPVGIASAWLEKKSSMTDEQFQDYIQNSIASLAPRQSR